MIKLPVVNKGVTLQEIPGQISVFFEIGNCKQRCKGCHSPYLSIPLAKVHWTEVTEMVHYAETEKARGATAIVLMGGTTNGVVLEDLKKAIEILANVLPVGIYSGAPVNSLTTKFLMAIPVLSWLKAGEYKEKLGGLNSFTTNQRFFVRVKDFWKDRTQMFTAPLI